MGKISKKIRGISKAWYGWTPDVPDRRDLRFSLQPTTLKALPPLVDLRSKMPPVYNQGALGSCTANAIVAAMQYNQIRLRLPVVMLSRLFVYYLERQSEGTIGTDAGAMIRTGIKVVNKVGASTERTWPYVIKKFTVRPPNQAYAEAPKHREVEYMRVTQTLDQMKGVLAEGFPFVTGISVYQSFESDQVAHTGIVPMPAANEQLLGGHAVLVVGYNDAREVFICRNSWGADWGQKGYFNLPYGFLADADLAADMWVIRKVNG